MRQRLKKGWKSFFNARSGFGQTLAVGNDRSTQHHLAQKLLYALTGYLQQNGRLCDQPFANGARIDGHGAGPVRPPMNDLKPVETGKRALVIKSPGPQ